MELSPANSEEKDYQRKGIYEGNEKNNEKIFYVFLISRHVNW